MTDSFVADVLTLIDRAASGEGEVAAVQVVCAEVGITIVECLDGRKSNTWVADLASSLVARRLTDPRAVEMVDALIDLLAGTGWANRAGSGDTLAYLVGSNLADADPDGATARIRRTPDAPEFMVGVARRTTQAFRSRFRDECTRCARGLYEREGRRALRWALGILLLVEPRYPRQLAAILDPKSPPDLSVDAVLAFNRRVSGEATMFTDDVAIISEALAAPVSEGAVALTDLGRGSVLDYVQKFQLPLAA